ncbi:TonB-dependent receptor [Methyloferula stellata]|uniref:TonB-dependent receptor n=1 Tax=Methyloferula stellata TaxID=876270 RepID=UPI00037E67A1|nr:TonB-dependent receptor [Methyloferula stellata]
MRSSFCCFLLAGSALPALLSLQSPAFAEERLPQVDVTAAPLAPLTPDSASSNGSGVGAVLAPSPQVLAETIKLDAARRDIFTQAGANTTSIDDKAIEAMPQGTDQSFDKVLLQLPGVSQDSAASGDLHIRNEHANVQYRINGILLPDGVSGFGQILDTSFVGRLSLVDGVLPAEFGLHTAGLIDIETRSGTYQPGGTISMYGGSHDTLLPSFSYGGTVGPTQFYMTGRFLNTNLGIENPTSSTEAIHDLSRQGRFFGYVSTLLDDSTRLSYLSGLSISGYQIPNTPGQAPQFTAFGVSNFDSSQLNENQVERNFYNVLAIQRTVGNIDGQLAFFSRYSTLHFVPDPIGDLVFNGVASDVTRESLLNGFQGDMAYHFGLHTMRAGFQVSAEKTRAIDSNTVLPLDDMGNPVDAPFNIPGSSSKLGWIGSVYAQDEWKITPQVSVNGGVRFDQIDQYTDANQVSPRISFTYTPFEGTVFHAGYARYFTPPEQALAAPVNIAAFNNTTLQPSVMQNDPVKPERADYVDLGVTQKIPFVPGLEAGVDTYYKRARNLLDDGQFGQALVLTAFNYDRAYNTGVEFKANYVNENFRAYANLAWAKQRATDPSSNQYLFDADELAYAQTHYVYTDHAQTWTGSAGASYLLYGTRISADLTYGSGLRSGFANTGAVSPYAQVNLGISHEFPKDQLSPLGPLTVRFDVVNLLDHIYEIRDGSGIGVFAPQFGPRRGFFAGLSQKF